MQPLPFRPLPSGRRGGREPAAPFEHVRDALKRLHDPAALQTHPLARLLFAGTGGGAGKALRQALLDAIAAMRPGPGQAERSLPSRSYEILRRRYVDGMPAGTVQTELAISSSEYHRAHRLGLEAVSSWLQERWAAAEGADVGNPGALGGDPGEPPSPATSFIGRERELAALRELLGRGRLLTIVGPPGVGKTRLALALADAVRGEYAGGAVFVALDAVLEADRVLPAIARALGLQDLPGRPLALRLRDRLGQRPPLLVLDNCEHLLGASPAVAELLAACPRLVVLATSRVPLHLAGEQQFRAPPLALPDPAAFGDGPRLREYEAVRLFIDRARAVEPGLEPAGPDLAAVAELCRRLDGLPLAIELAAARANVLPPAELLPRLGRQLPLLTGGPRDAPQRQRTLRGAVAWSHDLLDPAAQRLFRRLAVFVGGFSAEDAAAVCAAGQARPTGGDTPPIGEADWDGLAALVDHSLLRRERQADGRNRFRMLESIREFAMERLEEHGELEALRARHANHFLALAEQADPELRGPRQLGWFARLEAEQDNWRAALDWAIRRGEAATALRLGGALEWYWRRWGDMAEGQSWLERALALPAAGVPATVRAKALFGAGRLALFRGDYDAGHAWLEECRALWASLGDERGLAYALAYLSRWAMRQGDRPAARAFAADSAARFREVGDKWGLALALFYLGPALLPASGQPPAEAIAQGRAAATESAALFGEVGDGWAKLLPLETLANLAFVAGERATARALHTERVELAKAFGDAFGAHTALVHLGGCALLAGDLALAADCFEEIIVLTRRQGHRQDLAVAHCKLGQVALTRGEAARASVLTAEGLALGRELGPGRPTAVLLWALAAVASAAGAAAEAARLLGAAAAAFPSIAATLVPPDRAEWQQVTAATRAALGEPAFAKAWAQGQALTREQAFERAQQLAASLVARPAIPAAPAERAPMLTRREREVAGQVARGLTDRQIGQALGIAEGTVGVHIEHILGKLGFRSRAQIAAWAAEQRMGALSAR